MTLDRDNSSNNNSDGNLWSRLGSIVGGKGDGSARDALEEYIEAPENGSPDSASAQEKLLLSNILKLRDIKVVDVMIPRADIVAAEIGSSHNDLLRLFAEEQCSRIPIYRGKLDHIVGTIHVKDVLSVLANGKKIRVKDLLTDLPVVSPAMDVLDLILDMRQKHRHMVMVIDEYGGVDGLVTINDIIETIVGDIDDEHDREEDTPQMTNQPDGSILADARVDIEDFEDRFGKLFSEEEREESDTLGGLVCDMAGRVPAKGEVLTHESGILFEVIDADPRRINQIRIHNLP